MPTTSRHSLRLSLFFLILLQRLDHQRLLARKLPQLAVLLLQLLDPPHLGGLHAAESTPPAVERLFANTVLTNNFLLVRCALRLAENRDDLLVGELLPGHATPPAPARNLTIKSDQNLGEMSAVLVGNVSQKSMGSAEDFWLAHMGDRSNCPLAGRIQVSSLTAINIT
jgi:hypothetical protein